MALFAIIVCVCVIAVGCGNLPTPGSPSCVADDGSFTDAFDSESPCGWAVFQTESEVVAIDNGAMGIRTTTPGFLAWSNPGESFSDTTLTVESRQIAGPNNNAYGPICRYQDEDNFYVFLVSGDGYYAIGKYQSGSADIIYLTGEAPNHYIQTDVINQGAAPNRIQISCLADQLTLTVNGTQLAQVNDSAFATGDIGLSASLLEAGTLIVEYDNVIVEAP